MAVKRKLPGSGTTIVGTVEQFEEAKELQKTAKKRYDKLREAIVDFLQSNGSPDSDGHLWFDLPEEVFGKERLKYEKRTPSPSLDETKAEKLLKRRDLLEECQTTITVLDESKILKLYHEGRLSEKDLDSIYSASDPTWALKVV